MFRCNWLELAVFWLPMFIMQDICLHKAGNKTISSKWSGIYEMSGFMHQVLAYGAETGSFTKNGTAYDRRILVCDPNHCDSFSDDHCIYFNSRTYAWEVPAYAQSGVSSVYGAAFNFISADVNEINAGGYLSSDNGKGDANGDGSVNMKDLVLLQRYLNQWAVNINLSACDINGDGSVNMKDYVALQRKLNGWAV